MTDTLRDRLQSSLGSAYTIERELGGGGMSRVFVADDVALGRPVVVKVLSPELAAGLNIDRFRREIRLAARLQHPHIVPVLQAGETDGLPYFTMPFVKGESLRARVEKGPLPHGETVSILRDVAKALEYAHAQDVVHRDIKPDNVLLAGNAAVVTDFGIAKAVSASKTLPPGSTLTQAGTTIGTPAYMAPEQAAADPAADHRSDIYAFGVLAYELLAGHPPFAGRSPQKLLAAQLSERPAPIESIRPDTPPALAALVMRCLEKNADDRPPTAAALLEALDAVTTSGSASPAPALLLGGRAALRNALLIWGATFLIVALAARIGTAEIGLPDWVFPGAVVVMLLGLPMILFTGYVQRTLHRSFTRTPTLTPGGTPAPASTMATLALKASPHVSWRRTAMGGAIALGALVLLIVGYMVSWAMGIGPAGSLMGAGKMHVRDRLILTDFRDAGSDSTVAGAVSEAVRADLGESPVITLLTSADVASALRLMQRPANTHIDVPVAEEVAAREGAKGIVDGTVTPVGAGYLVTLRLVSLSGADLASFHDGADRPSQLLPTLDRLARRLRAKIGESLKSVQGDPPLEQVTTPSLAALRKYHDAKHLADEEGRIDDALAMLRDAVALDTSFAMAYRAIGIGMANFGLPQPGIDSALTRAYQLRSHLTERERYLAEASYFESGPGHDREQAVRAYRALLARDPEDPTALTNLGNIYERRRQYKAADSLFRHVVATNPPSALYLGNLAEIEISEGDTASASHDDSIILRQFPNAIQGPGWAWSLAYDRNAMATLDSIGQRALSSRAGDLRSAGAFWLAMSSILRGQPSAWARAAKEGSRIDAARGVVDPPLLDSMMAAALDITVRENPSRGVRRLDTALIQTRLQSLPISARPYFLIANLYALGGRPDRARAIVGEYAVAVKDSAERRGDEPDLHGALGEIALAEHRPQDALREFARADTGADGYPVPCAICYPLDAARAYDETGNRDSAILMFERYEQTPARFESFGPTVDVLFRALGYKRLGELYENKGDAQHAAANYRQFIALWKDADPDLQPLVAEVRRGLAKLTGEPARERQER